jgi:hypothetical protein
MTQHANYVKCSIGAQSRAEKESDTDQDPTNTLQTPTKRVNFADTASAGDHMSHGSRNYISQVRSGRHYTSSQRTISFIYRHEDLDADSSVIYLMGSSFV